MVVGKTFPLSFVLSAVDNLSGPLKKVQGRLGAIGKATTRVGRGFTLGVTGPLLALGGATIRTAATFEESMNVVQAITDATGDDFKALRGQALLLGKTTVFTASQVADGMTELAVSSFKANEILAVTPAVLDLAAASGLELARTSEILAGVLRATGKEAEDARDVADILANGFTNSAVKLDDLAEALTISIPVLRGMGIELEENVALIGKLGDNMFRGSLAGTALKRAASALANAPPLTQATLANLKIFKEDILDSRGNVRSLIDVVDLLGLKSATTGEMLRIFGERAGPGMGALVNSGAESVKRLEAKLNTSGTAAKIAEARMKGAAGGTRELRSATEGLLIAIADSGLLAQFTLILEKLTAWVLKTSEASPEMLKMGVNIALAAAALGPIILLIGNVIKVVGVLVTGVKLLGIALLWMSANPIGLTILAVAAFVAGGVALVKNWDAIKAKAKSTWTFVKNVVGNALSWIWNKLKQFTLLPKWLERMLGISTGGGGDVIGALTGPGGAGIGPGGAPIGATSDPIARAENLSRAEAEVRVRFDQVPAGVTIEADPGVEVDLDLGFAMVAGA